MGEARAVDAQLSLAERWLRDGRRARGYARLRALVGVCRRRGHARRAARVALALARSLLARGDAAGAQSVLDEVRVDCAGDEQLAVDMAVLDGWAWLDRAELGRAEAVLRAAVDGARRCSGRAHPVSPSSVLARCAFWQGRYAEAFERAAASAEEGQVRALALQARAAIGLGDRTLARRCANDARAAAEGQADPDLLYQAAYAGTWVALCDADYRGVERMAAIACEATRRSHNPIGRLKTRLLQAEAERRAARVSLARRLTRRLLVRSARGGHDRAMPGIPPIVRLRCDLLARLLAVTDPEAVVRSCVRESGLAALALLVPRGVGATAGPQPIDDIAALLDASQESCDPRVALEALCRRLRETLGATYVGVHALLPPFASLTSPGGRADPQLIARIAETGCAVMPDGEEGALEGGAPIRVEGRTVGVLVTRSRRDGVPAGERWWSLSAAAAGLAGPLTDSRLVQRVAGAGDKDANGANDASDVTDGDDDGMVGRSRAFAITRRAMREAAAVTFPVLIEGESGSGKELVARAIHARGARREQALRTLNCAALPDDLAEAELFGCARGAFTGAVSDRAGLFEDAHGGTLFLDEVGELTARVQAKLLRTIQEGEIRRVGETRSRRVDVRLIAATNRNLQQEVEAGRFRLDLWYRLDVLHVTVPALRERREDIPMLAMHLWTRQTAHTGSRAVLADAVLGALERYDWPGNIRELENVLAVLAVRAPKRGVVQIASLPGRLVGAVGSEAHGSQGDLPQGERQGATTLADARRQFDASFIASTLGRHHGCRTRAARELGVTRQGLAKLVQRLRLGSGEEADRIGRGARCGPDAEEPAGPVDGGT